MEVTKYYKSLISTEVMIFVTYRCKGLQSHLISLNAYEKIVKVEGIN